MKNLKISLTAIIFAIILTISTGVYAYGSQVDTANVITMPSTLNNGTGNVTTTLSGAMSYQFVEITSEKYQKIKKYEAIYNLIKAHINSDSNYETLLAKYQQTYNETANAIINTYGIQFNEEGLNAIKGLWITELTTYSESAWVESNGTTISIDLTTFKGTKYYIAWVKIGDTYDAQAYIVTGTKKDEDNKEPENKPNEDNKDENKNETPNNNTTNNNLVNDNKTTNNNDALTPAKKQDTTASSAGKTMPKTGVSSTILGLIAVAGASAGVSYIKYRKIK